MDMIGDQPVFGRKSANPRDNAQVDRLGRTNHAADAAQPHMPYARHLDGGRAALPRPAACEADGEREREGAGRCRRMDAPRSEDGPLHRRVDRERSEEQTSELQSLMRISYAVFCLKKKN